MIKNKAACAASGAGGLPGPRWHVQLCAVSFVLVQSEIYVSLFARAHACMCKRCKWLRARVRSNTNGCFVTDRLSNLSRIRAQHEATFSCGRLSSSCITKKSSKNLSVSRLCRSPQVWFSAAIKDVARNPYICDWVQRAQCMVL